MNCPNCNNIVPDNSDVCNKCGYIFNNYTPYPNYQNINQYTTNNISNTQNNSHTGLGIASFILSILGCTSLIGLILGIIDVCNKNNRKKALSIAAIVISSIWILLSIVFIAMPTEDGSSQTSSISNETTERYVDDIDDDTSKNTEIKSTTEEITDKDDGLTTGQKNALKTADSYLSSMAFSHDGLIDQLIYEKYSEEDATFAADNCGADWNEEAVESAKSYISSMAFSYEGLISQLEYEKYTHEEAVYGVDNCEADWKEEAAESAKSYLDSMSFSRDGLIEQLKYEGFTQEEAEYGVEQNGY